MFGTERRLKTITLAAGMFGLALMQAMPANAQQTGSTAGVNVPATSMPIAASGDARAPYASVIVFSRRSVPNI